MHISNENCCNSADEISLYDIWQKLVAYKKTFWAIFCVVLLVGSIVVFITPERYKFTQLFEVGRYLNSELEEVPIINDKELLGLVKTIYLTEVIREYQTKVDSKIILDAFKNKISISYLGGKSFALDARDKLDNSNIYRIIFQNVVDKIVTYRADDVYLIKINLEKAEKNIKDIIEQDEGLAGVDTTNRAVNFFSKDKQMEVVFLIDKINSIQARIDGVCNTKAVGDLIIEKAAGPSKLVLLILAAIASLFFAFFGVFVADFFVKILKIRLS